MQRFFLLPAICLVFLAGCGADTHESLMKEQLAAMKELNSVLSEVKDKDSFEANKGRIEAIGKQMKSLEERMKTIGEPSAEKQEELKEKYAGELMSTGLGLMGNLMRVSQIEGVEGLDDLQIK